MRCIHALPFVATLVMPWGQLLAEEPGEYHEAIATADDDDQGVMGNESLTLDVRQDEPIFFRVSTYDDAADYIIKAGMVGAVSPPEE